MKSIILYLIGLNIFVLPSTALANSSLLKNTAKETILLSQVEEETPTREEDEPESEVTNEDESAEEPESKTEKTEETETADEYTPEEMARLKKLAIADRLYLSGYKADAVKFYRQAKEVWELEQKAINQDESVEPFDDPKRLSPAGKVFWRNYQQGKQQQLESKIFSALNLLTTREPQFIPGHIHYAQMLQEYEREIKSHEVLDKAVNRYPHQPKLIQARIDAHTAAEEWLDASVLARQFALFNPDIPKAREFERQAEQYLAEYQSDLRSDLAINAVGNAIVGTLGFALTGSLFGPLSALETTAMLLQGESAIGEASVRQAKRQLPLIEDPEILQYVDEMGQKVAAASGRDDFEYEFHVIMDDSLNAFALPGGKIFVNAGAIMKTDSEAELAGLLAHEVSHAALSHGFQLVTQGNLTANIVRYIPYVGNAASSLIVLNYSRGMEKQADIFGTRILVNSGYAADGVRNLMVKLHESHQQSDRSEPPEWLSSHPNSKQRIRYMEELIVDRNLNRFTYEGVSRHREIRHLVTEKWLEYEKCVEEVVTIEGAKECVRDEERESELNQENNSQNNEPESEE